MASYNFFMPHQSFVVNLKICKRYKKLRIINDQWDKDSFVSKTCRTIQKCSKQLFRKNVNTIKGDPFMNTYIIYFVSVINCYVSAQLIFDHFKINFNSTYSKKWIYNIVTIFRRSLNWNYKSFLITLF